MQVARDEKQAVGKVEQPTKCRPADLQRVHNVGAPEKLVKNGKGAFVGAGLERHVLEVHDRS